MLTILSAKSVTIKNTNAAATTELIEIASGVNANIKLAGVNIDVSSNAYTAAFKIADNSTGNVTITLAEGTQSPEERREMCGFTEKRRHSFEKAYY